jgi:hypothetical protein
MARKIDLIIIHCSDTPNGRALFSRLGNKVVTPVEEIDHWHRQRVPPFKRMQQWREKQNPALTSIGYHFVIYTNGAVATGRHLDEIGSHCQGYNAVSLGICLVGRDAFTRAQWLALGQLVDSLKKRYPTARVRGHRDYTQGKTCPNFEVASWWASGAQPLLSQLYVEPADGGKPA